MNIRQSLKNNPWLIASVLAYTACLFFDTIKIFDVNNPQAAGYLYPGYYMFILGVFGLLVLQFSWLANPLIFVTWLTIGFRNSKLAAALG